MGISNTPKPNRYVCTPCVQISEATIVPIELPSIQTVLYSQTPFSSVSSEVAYRPDLQGTKKFLRKSTDARPNQIRFNTEYDPSQNSEVHHCIHLQYLAVVGGA
jgi:hypothetical protein